MTGIVVHEELAFSGEETDEWDASYMVDNFIALWRSPEQGEVDLLETARNAGVGLVIRHNYPRATLSLVGDEELFPWPLKPQTRNSYMLKIHLDKTLDPIDQACRMGHELGHLVLLKFGHTIKPNAVSEKEWIFQERFAEYFARKFIKSGNGTLPYDPPPESHNRGEL